MAALLTVLAIVGGIALGLANGGSFDRVRRFRPALWPALAIGVALQLLIRAADLTGNAAVVVELFGASALLAFAIANIRVGGMVLVVAGLALNLLPTVINWGMPTSRDALITAGVIDEDDPVENIELSGARHVADEDDALRWLGETIALPSGQVISLGDVVLQFGYLLVVASLLRGRVVRRETDGDYRRRIAPLGKGPARRRGPGLHPSRLDQGLGRARERARGDAAMQDALDER